MRQRLGVPARARRTATCRARVAERGHHRRGELFANRRAPVDVKLTARVAGAASCVSPGDSSDTSEETPCSGQKNLAARVSRPRSSSRARSCSASREKCAGNAGEACTMRRYVSARRRAARASPEAAEENEPPSFVNAADAAESESSRVDVGEKLAERERKAFRSPLEPPTFSSRAFSFSFSRGEPTGTPRASRTPARPAPTSPPPRRALRQSLSRPPGTRASRRACTCAPTS